MVSVRLVPWPKPRRKCGGSSEISYRSGGFLTDTSYYSDASVTARVPLDRHELLRARHALIDAGLIAFEPPLYQVLSLDLDAPATPAPRRSSAPLRLSEVLQQLRKPT